MTQTNCSKDSKHNRAESCTDGRAVAETSRRKSNGADKGRHRGQTSQEEDNPSRGDVCMELIREEQKEGSESTWSWRRAGSEWSSPGASVAQILKPILFKMQWDSKGDMVREEQCS